MGNLLCACTKGEADNELLKSKECTVAWSDPVVSLDVQAEPAKDTQVPEEDQEGETKQNGTLSDSLSSPSRMWQKDVVLKSLSVDVPESFKRAGRPVYGTSFNSKLI